MKRRKYCQQAWALIFLSLILSGSVTSGLHLKTALKKEKSQTVLQRTERQTHPQYYEYQQPYELQQATARQGDDGLITTVISLALKYGPTLFNYVLGGGSSAQQQTTDRIEELEIKEEDPLSTSNLIAMAIKVALALFSSATSGGGIDKSDVVSPTQSILGIVISALTGSEDPEEVSLMAKQATEVVNMLISLTEALQTSFSSS